MIRCEICEEVLAADEEELAESPHVGSGEIAEMFNACTGQGGVVHAQCGISAGWEIS